MEKILFESLNAICHSEPQAKNPDIEAEMPLQSSGCAAGKRRSFDKLRAGSQNDNDFHSTQNERSKIHLLMTSFFTATLLFTVAFAQNNANRPDNTQKSAPTKTILFLGNSLTAGYGLEPSQAFPALIQQKLDSLGWHYTAVNAGLSGETSAGGLRRLNWLLRRPVDVLVLALGANDGLRGFPPEHTEKNLQQIIDTVREKNPDCRIVIAGMEALPNMGETYVKQFRELFPRLARKNNAALIPFLLAEVAGISELNLPDGIHPNVAGQKIVAENVWAALKPVLKPEKGTQ